MESKPNTVTFGKYDGKSYDEVKHTDIAYCNWVLKQTEIRGRMKLFQDWLKKTSTKRATCEMCNGSGNVCVM
jgi:hypothetical protein